MLLQYSSLQRRDRRGGKGRSGEGREGRGEKGERRREKGEGRGKEGDTRGGQLRTVNCCGSAHPLTCMLHTLQGCRLGMQSHPLAQYKGHHCSPAVEQSLATLAFLPTLRTLQPHAWTLYSKDVQDVLEHTDLFPRLVLSLPRFLQSKHSPPLLVNVIGWCLPILHPGVGPL